MATRQIGVLDQNGPLPTLTWGVASGAVGTIDAGTPTKQGTAGNIVPMVDGDGTTSQRFIGIAKNLSTDTVSVAGTVDVILPLPGIIYVGAAKSATAANTAAKVAALMYKRIVFDLTAAVWTVDSAAGDATTNGLVIVGGEFQTNSLYFMIMPSISFLGNVTT